jgi:pyridoxal phosphate enzyme (YggS family)
MNSIPERLAAVHRRIAAAAARYGRKPGDVELLAVSKTKPVEDIVAAWDAGQRAFGENYLQDALPKIEALRGRAIEWHFIGRLQSNKTAAIAAQFDWVHTVERLKHAQRLADQRPDALPPLQVCLQVNLSGEASKGGVDADTLGDLAAAVARLPRIALRGLMTLPAPTTDFSAQRAVFRRLRELREQLGRDGIALDTLSMGMSGDLEAAIAEGATIVRVGTDVFGARR